MPPRDGTPLISSMFQLARENSNSDLLCIINADMILMSDFLEATRRSRLSSSIPDRGLRDKFVLLSQRWDMDITQPIEFNEGWEHRLSSMVHRQGHLHRPAGSAFFSPNPATPMSQTLPSVAPVGTTG